MNDREKRDFEAGLNAEIDAWLRGENTRRSFIRKFGLMTGLLATSSGILGPWAENALAQAAVDLADPSTPLGKAQAAAMQASTEGPADGSAYRAAQAAKQYSGITLNYLSESALMAEGPKQFSGPKWQELTGITINTVEKPFPELFPTMVQEHIAATGALDVMDVVPAWLADMVTQGIVEPLDPFIEQYMNPADLEDIHPVYRNLMNYGGNIYGLFDDGDTFLLYYNREIFDNPDYQAEFPIDVVK